MKFKHLFSASLLFLSSFASANYLCSYTAVIGDDDKFNSSGDYLGSSYTKSSVAGILRQDRANFYAFGISQEGDQGDCVMHSKKARATFEKLLNQGTISKSAIRRIIDGNPVVRVHLFTNYVNVEIF